MRLIRVFPRRTRATPTDELVYVGLPDFFAEADAVHISATFTWDVPVAEQLANEWEHVAPVAIGGPATGQRGEDFIPGRYLKPGYVITSRGCPNHCWFCSVWRRDGNVRELPITEGWNVLDDNLLACSEQHIRAVFAMLARQRTRPEFTGGLEPARLRPWHVELLCGLRPRPVIFLAYDTVDDWEPLIGAMALLHDADFNRKSHDLRCYVLIGQPNDTLSAAESRLTATLNLGLTPMAMLWRDSRGLTDPTWRRFQRSWVRPAAIYAKERNPLDTSFPQP